MENLSRVVKKSEQYPSWKKEVNERVAAHLHRKSAPADGTRTPRETNPAPVGRAAQAAARVAARYANAPSYNEMLAEEARAAVRVAEAASLAAQEAHAAAQSILDGIEAATDQASWEPETERGAIQEHRGAKDGIASRQAPADSFHFDESPLFNSSGGADLPGRTAEQATVRGNFRESRPSIFEAPPEETDGLSAAPSAQGGGDIFAGEAAQPIYANLIQFPREVIATRRVRPRRDEGPLAGAAPGLQLSIFEVDPGAISNQPGIPAADEPAAPAWMRPEWPAFELEEQPRENLREELEPQVQRTLPFALAPLSRRLIAIVVDVSLVCAVFAAVAMRAATYANKFHSPRVAAVIGVLTLLAIGAGYLTLFFTLARSTPGMRYGGIALSTLDGDCPTRAQRCRRLMVLPLSVLPLGLGLAWALFDEFNLTWHDRLSGTYLRRR
jgi:uncharacterized RDD family membrane protein YckC